MINRCCCWCDGHVCSRLFPEAWRCNISTRERENIHTDNCQIQHSCVWENKQTSWKLFVCFCRSVIPGSGGIWNVCLSSVFFTSWSRPCLAFLESSSCSLPSQTCWFLPSFFLASSGSCGANFFFLTRFRGFRIQSKLVATLAIVRVSSYLRESRAPPDSESTFAILFCGIKRIDTRQELQFVLCHHS